MSTFSQRIMVNNMRNHLERQQTDRSLPTPENLYNNNISTIIFFFTDFADLSSNMGSVSKKKRKVDDRYPCQPHPGLQGQRRATTLYLQYRQFCSRYQLFVCLFFANRCRMCYEYHVQQISYFLIIHTFLIYV